MFVADAIVPAIYSHVCASYLHIRQMSMLVNNNSREPRRKSVTLQGSALFLLSFQTLGTHAFSHLRLAFLDPSSGIVYSDLGTSPLYTFNGIWPANGPLPPAEDVIGGVSAIIWAITLLPLIKYASVYLLSLSIYVTM